MAWTSPMTAVANSVFTAAQFNAHVRDNLNETAPAKATEAGQIFAATGPNAIAARRPSTDIISSTEDTTSTVYTDLITAGPSFTVTTGARAMVIVSCSLSNNTAAAKSHAAYEVSGATAIAAADAQSARFESAIANQDAKMSAVDFQAGLTPGNNVFTMKYRVDAGTGSFAFRRLIVVPF